MRSLQERRRRSARETFAACRLKFKAEFIDEIDMSSAATRRGTAFHKAAETYVAALFAAKLTDDAELAQNALSQARVETPGLGFEEFADLEALWGRWVPEFRLDIERHVAVETELPVFGTVLRLDRIEAVDADTLRIHDAKTSWAITPQPVLENSWQTNLYLAGARRVFPGWRRYQMVYEWVRWGAVSAVIEKTDAELDLVEVAIAESDAAMAAAEALVYGTRMFSTPENAHEPYTGAPEGAFPATGGRHCATCTIAHTACPLVSNGWAPTVTPQEAVGRVAALDRARTLLLEGLRSYAKANGPVEAGGVEWAFRPRVEVKYPAQAVTDMLSSHGLAASHLMLSASAVKSIIESKKKYWAVSDRIKGLGVTQQAGTVFSGKAVVPDDDEQAEAE